MKGVPVSAGIGALMLWLAAAWGCTSNGTSGGPVAGQADNHCFLLPDGGTPGGPLSAQPTHESACHPTNVDGGGPSGPVYGPTMFNASGNDDDCKSQVGYWSTPVQQGKDVTFTVSAIHTTDGTALTSAAPYAEVFLNDHHPAPNSNVAMTETPDAGVYAIGPVRFDAPGQWTVRFHFRADCDDLTPDSPHGHAAFYVQVP